jgi:hypothetical protein
VTLQPDLFGLADDNAAREAARTARAERFHQLATTDPDGQPVNGFRCWLCGTTEAAGHLIGVRHGLWAEMPGVFERTMCDLMEATA